MIRRILPALAACAAVLSSVAAAQDFPAKPIRLILAYAPGGSSDALARQLAAGMSQRLNQSVVVDNRPGAGTLIATQAVASSAADGYTLLYTASPLVQNPILSKEWNVDPLTQLAPVTQVVRLPVYFVMNPNKLPNVRTMREFIAHAKASPSAVNIASAGTDLGYRLFNHLAGTKIEIVNFKSEAPAVQAVLAGDAQLTYGALSTVTPHAKAGNLRLIGVSSLTRFPLAADVPTLDESGLKGFDFVIWHGVLAAAKTPANVIGTLNNAAVETLRSPPLTKLLQDQGFFVIADKPEEFRAMLAEELGTWKRLAGTLGIVAQ